MVWALPRFGFPLSRAASPRTAKGANRGSGKLALLGDLCAGCARTDIAAGTADAVLPRGLGSNSSRTISLPKDAFKNGKGAPREDCQWPSVSPHPRPSFLPTDGHVFSPLVATNLPTLRGCFFERLGQRLDPLAGGCLSEAVAVLAVGDHEGNATLNYRSVLARELTVEDAELYRRPGHRRRSRRVGPAGEGSISV